LVQPNRVLLPTPALDQERRLCERVEDLPVQ
jgi:hypothetical protein